MAARKERPAGAREPGGRGRLFVDLLTALDGEMRAVADVFPSTGPPPCARPARVADVVLRHGGDLGPVVRRVVRRWAEQRDRFDEAAAALEALNHGDRATADARDALAVRIRALRDARRELEVLACEVRDAVASALDDGR